MSTNTKTTKSTDATVDTHENILDKVNKSMNAFDGAKRARHNLSNIGTITDVKFKTSILNTVLGLAPKMEVYPPRRMVTYGQ